MKALCKCKIGVLTTLTLGKKRQLYYSLFKAERESFDLKKEIGRKRKKCGKTTYVLVYIENGIRRCIHALCKVYKISKNTISNLNKMSEKKQLC